MSRSNFSKCRSPSHRAAHDYVEPLERRALFSATPVIDVMVLYTPEALAGAGGVAAIEARIHRAAADANLALANSHVNAIIRVVHDERVQYSETGVLALDLNNLQTASGGLQNVPALRSHYGADLVSLWVGSGDEGGRAFQPDDLSTPHPELGFSVLQQQYADDNFIFAHEIGHNLGAGHDRTDSTPRAIPYAYGKQFSLGNYTVGDIMSNGERVDYYSNPNVSFRNIPTGNPDNSAAAADNARVMNQFAPMVSNYVGSTMPDRTAPAAAIEAVVADPIHQTLTVRVEYADDTAISTASLGTGDVLVSGPGGISKLAAYQGLDFASDGAQRVAAYRISTAGSSADPNAYSFILEPNQVRDLNGNVAATGALHAPTTAFADRAGPRLLTAFEAGSLDSTNWRFDDSIGSDSPGAFYRFTLNSRQQFTARLSGLQASVDELLVQDHNADGQIQSNDILSYPHRSGTSPETISAILAPGTYDVWVAAAVQGTRSPYTLNLSAATPAATTGALAGSVYQEVNGRIAGGLAYARVFVDLYHAGAYRAGDPTAMTDSAGNYRFANLPVGSYQILTAPSGGFRQYLPADNAAQATTVRAGQTTAVQPFLETQQGLISGSVFNDRDNNGIRDATDPQISGVRVFLDASGAAERSVLTNSQGGWSFNDLTSGSYTVRVVAPAGWKITTPSAYHLTIFNGRVLSGLLFGEHLI